MIASMRLVLPLLWSPTMTYRGAWKPAPRIEVAWCKAETMRPGSSSQDAAAVLHARRCQSGRLRPFCTAAVLHARRCQSGWLRPFCRISRFISRIVAPAQVLPAACTPHLYPLCYITRFDDRSFQEYARKSAARGPCTERPGQILRDIFALCSDWRSPSGTLCGLCAIW